MAASPRAWVRIALPVSAAIDARQLLADRRRGRRRCASSSRPRSRAGSARQCAERRRRRPRRRGRRPRRPPRGTLPSGSRREGFSTSIRSPLGGVDPVAADQHLAPGSSSASGHDGTSEIGSSLQPRRALVELGDARVVGVVEALRRAPRRSARGRASLSGSSTPGVRPRPRRTARGPCASARARSRPCAAR